MNADPRNQHFKELCERINRVIGEKWAGALAEDGNAFAWARENEAEMIVKHDAQQKEINDLWLNLAPMEQFKQACTDWGRTVLEIHRLFATEIRQKDAA